MNNLIESLYKIFNRNKRKTLIHPWFVLIFALNFCELFLMNWPLGGVRGQWQCCPFKWRFWCVSPAVMQHDQEESSPPGPSHSHRGGEIPSDRMENSSHSSPPRWEERSAQSSPREQNTQSDDQLPRRYFREGKRAGANGNGFDLPFGVFLTFCWLVDLFENNSF